MAGHNPHPQAETLQATASESSETFPARRNLRDPVRGLISDLQNFAIYYDLLRSTSIYDCLLLPTTIYYYLLLASLLPSTAIYCYPLLCTTIHCVLLLATAIY